MSPYNTIQAFRKNSVKYKEVLTENSWLINRMHDIYKYIVVEEDRKF